MSRFTDSPWAARPAALFLAGVAAAAIAVSAIAAAPGRPAALPGASPSAAPTATQSAAPDPTPVPTPVVSPKPVPSSAPVGGDGRITVQLDTFDRHDVSVAIADRTGTLVRAVSGTPGDNPSADGLAVRNLDNRTLELTWVDFPIDNDLTLFVDQADGHLRLLLVQPEPTGPDGCDRVRPPARS